MSAHDDKAEVREILEGYVDQKTRVHAIHAIGESGLNSRMISILFLAAFVSSLNRSFGRNFFRYFTGVIDPIIETAQSAWLTEILRIMDSANDNGKTRLTVALCHGQFGRCTKFSKEEKAEEQRLHKSLTDAYEGEQFRQFRNERMFHLDLTKTLDPPRPSGDMQRVSAALCHWYRFVASATIGDEPRFVTETAPSNGREQAKVIKRLLLDSIRWQAAKGPPYRANAYVRYGWASGEWISWMHDLPPTSRVLRRFGPRVGPILTRPHE